MAQLPKSKRVVESLDDVATLEREIGLLFGRFHSIQAKAQKECSPIVKRAARQSAPLLREITRLAREIDRFARKNRATLTKNGVVKTVPLPSGGALRWRKSPPGVEIENEEQVLAFLLEHGINDFVRVSHAINKTAMREHPVRARRIPGVRVASTNRFIIDIGSVPERLERFSTSKRFYVMRSRSQT